MTGAPLWFVGVDGGATRCRVRVRDSVGRALVEALGPSANIHVDFAASIAAARSVVVDALAKSGLADADLPRAAIGLGLAGVNDGEDAERVVAAFPGYARACAANDAVTACIGAHAGADGGLVIAGTGSAAIVRVAGRQTIVGGRGFALGDDGSGAHVGLDGLRAATLAHDGLGPASALTGDLTDAFDGDIVALIRWARTARPGDFGAFAPRVFARAAEGDPIALAVVGSAARAIGVLALRAVALGAARVALVGGVGEALRPYFDPAVGALLTRPLHDATDGAILMAGGRVETGKETEP
jgi:glucosamine kinase